MITVWVPYRTYRVTYRTQTVIMAPDLLSGPLGYARLRYIAPEHRDL